MTEDLIQTLDSVEKLLPVAQDMVSHYCAERGIDEADINPIIWLDIIDELNIKLFEPNKRLLKTESNLYNQYDRDKVIYIYKRIYKKLCYSHKQEVCQKGFLDMTGIDKQTLYNWGKESSAASFDLQQKISEDNEDSLWQMMKGDKGISTKYLAKLNRYHGWSAPGMQGDGQKHIQGRTPEQIAAEYGAELSQKGEQLRLPQMPE